jgi:hypothetical protein
LQDIAIHVVHSRINKFGLHVNTTYDEYRLAIIFSSFSVPAFIHVELYQQHRSVLRLPALH